MSGEKTIFGSISVLMRKSIPGVKTNQWDVWDEEGNYLGLIEFLRKKEYALQPKSTPLSVKNLFDIGLFIERSKV